GAGRSKLGLRMLLERRRPELVRELEALPEELTRLRALVRAPQRGSELDERAGVFEPRLRALEHVDRFAKQLLAGGAALDQAERPERDADRMRRRPRARAIDSLECERERLVAPAGRVERQRQVGAPV